MILQTEDNLLRLPEEVPFDFVVMAIYAGWTACNAMMALGGMKAVIRVGVIGPEGFGCIKVSAAEVNGAEITPLR